MELNIEKFSPTVAELTQLAAESKALTLPDPLDRIQLEAIKSARIKLKNARVAITKTGKALREDALSFQRAVISKEKELVSIIEPEEDRLAGLEEAADKAVEREARKELIPQRIDRIKKADPTAAYTEEQLLEMDGSAFEGFLNKIVADKNERDRQALAAEQKKIDDEKAALARKKELEEAEERGRKEAAEKAAREQKEKEEREAREKKEAEEKAERERIAKEQAEREEKERLEKEERYQTFLKEHGVPAAPEKFRIERSATEVRLYMLTGVLKLDQK